MCNELNDGVYKEILPFGYGWKIFEIRNNKLCPMRYDISNYYETDKWLVYRSDDLFTGFCFFVDYEEAIDVLQKWRKIFKHGSFCILKIYYRGGLGQQEMSIVGDRNHIGALAREIFIP